ncbi:MAG TPA: DUF2510 domain-containing protein [Acidimicrobiales bacterium]|nr:DUF2510 domain-containing protein [Acidimicrobiales bacterium]
MGAPAGWYPDPDGSGGQRYFDGGAWTGHRWPPPGPWSPPNWAPAAGYPWGAPPWKGAGLGRPAGGPGALADPGRRLGARPLFPVTSPDNLGARAPTPGIVWIYLAVFGALVATGLVAVV